MLALGCGSRVTPPGGDTDSTGSEGGPGNPSDPTSDTGDAGGGVQLTVNRDVDILFVIDNSGSMGRTQGRLASSSTALLSRLEDPALAANYRIGFTTTDNGNPWCGSTSPEAGKLQLSSCRSRTGEFVFNGNPPADATAIACTDVCATDSLEIVPTTTEFDSQPRPRPWLESSGGKTNLANDVTTTEALQCAGPQGIAGCGFESHLESMYKAFLRTQNSDEDAYGFLRTSAVLSIIIVSDEVDCSYNNAHQSIFLPESEGGNPSVFWSDPDASAPSSAVCWNAGVVCEGSGTPYDSCRSSNKDTNGNLDVADGDAVLHPVARYADFVQELESTKQQITPSQEVLVHLIAGVPDGYDGELTYANSLDPIDQGDFGIGPGCTFDDGDPQTPPATARPPVRMREFAEAFEVGGVPNIYSICQESYSDAFEAIANGIADQLRPACMSACVADTDQIMVGVQPQCTMIQDAPDPASGSVSEINVEACAAGDELPPGQDVCYVAMVNDQLSEVCAQEGWNLEFRLVRRPGVPAPGTAVSVACELSQNKAIDCPNLP